MSGQTMPQLSMGSSIEGFEEIDMPERLDSATAFDIEKDILTRIANGCQNVVLNFQHVHFLTAAGLRMVLVILRSVNEAQGHLTIDHLHGQARSMVEACGFDRFIPVQNSSDSSSSLAA